MRSGKGFSIAALVGGTLAAAVLVTLPVGAAAAAQCTIKQALAIPVSMQRLRPVVHTQVNGADVTMLVDSGAAFSLLTPAAAASLGLRTETSRGRPQLRGVGGSADLGVAKVDTFVLAGLQLQRIEFLVAGNDLVDDVAGLIGQNILGFADVEYDLAHGYVRLMRTEHCEKQDLAYWSDVGPTSSVAIDPTSVAQPHAIGTAYLNGKRIRVMFDTGASTSMLTARAAEHAGVKRGDQGVEPWGRAYGIGWRSVETWLARFDSFKIGDEEINNARLRIGDFGFDADMLLGADFFASHRIYVSKSQHRVFFTYAGGPVFDLARAHVAALSSDDAALTEIVIERQPRDAAGFGARGNTRASRSDYTGALLDLDQACAIEPDNARYHYDRALVEEQLARRESALHDLDESLRLRPEEPGALIARARIRLSLGKGSEAIDDLGAASRAMPTEDGRRRALADLFARARQYDAAVAQLDLWLATHPGDVFRAKALGGRCRMRIYQGRDRDAALKDCNASLDLEPTQTDFRLSRGIAFLLSGRPAQAVADFNAVIAAEPDNALARYGRGVATNHSDAGSAGAEDLDLARKLNPKIADAAQELGLPAP